MQKKSESEDNENRNLPVHSNKKELALSLKRQKFIGLVAVIVLVASVVSQERNLKKLEIIRKLIIEHCYPVCEQYALIAKKAQYYPCFECESGQIYLKPEEVWRYGFAGQGGEKARYPGNVFYQDEKWRLTTRHLQYKPQYKGIKLMCLIEEITKIIDYPDLPEAKARDIKLIRPPRNKQDR